MSSRAQHSICAVLCPKDAVPRGYCAQMLCPWGCCAQMLCQRMLCPWGAVPMGC